MPGLNADENMSEAVRSSVMKPKQVSVSLCFHLMQVKLDWIRSLLSLVCIVFNRNFPPVLK